MGLDSDTVTAVATALAAVVAAAAILVTVVLYRRDRAADDADHVREDLRAMSRSAGRSASLLLDGSAILGAAWKSATTAGGAADPTHRADSLRRLLQADGFGLSIAVTGWSEASQASELRASLSDLGDAGRRLTGRLSVLDEAGRLLQRIGNDVYMTFIRKVSEGELVQAFLHEQRTSQDGFVMVARLATSISSDTATYVVHRYAQALGHLDSFVRALSDALVHLPDRDLLALSRTGPPGSPDGSTTDSMRASLHALRGVIADDVLADLLATLDAIAVEISKEAASAGLETTRDG